MPDAQSGQSVTPAALPVARVLVVGSGPTGLVAASLLGHYGVPTLLIEQNATTSDQAKAISLDDESLRILQRAGLLEVVLPIVLPGTGTRYFGARGQTLAHARGPSPSLHGHPFKSAFQQPQLEAVLRGCLHQKFPAVTTSFSTTLEALDEGASGVTARLSLSSGEVVERRFDYVLGCDGGRSTVRRLLGVGMLGDNFQEPWIVIDTINDPHTERYGMHVGDPRRPHVIIPGLNGHCRYEFLLRPDESLGPEVPFELVRSLLAPYRPVDPQDVVRRTVYTFNALIAQRWRVGAAFLLGDAAHMMPPFAGQGMNAGLRDADNLSWKLVAVLNGQAGDGVLDSYERERRPHAEAMVALSARLGSVVMTTNPRVAHLRDAVIGLARLTPWGRQYFDEMRYRKPANYRHGVALNDGSPLVGRPMPQWWLLKASGGRCLLDEVLGDGFALVAVDPATDVLSTLDHPLWDQLGAQCVEFMTGERWARRDARYPTVVDDEERHRAVLRPAQGQVLLVRPDRYVAAVFSPVDQWVVAERFARVLDGRPTHKVAVQRSEAAALA